MPLRLVRRQERQHGTVSDMGSTTVSTALKLALGAAPLLLLVVIVLIAVVVGLALPSRMAFALKVADSAAKFASILLGHHTTREAKARRPDSRPSRS